MKPGRWATISTVPASRSATDSVPLPDSRIQSRPSCHRGECGIDSPPSTTSPEGTSSRTPPAALWSRQPPAVVGGAERRDVAHLVVDQREPVEVAAVLGGEAGDERRPPPRHEAVLAVEGGQAREAGVDDPQLAAGEADVVDPDVAGDVVGARHVAGVVATLGLELVARPPAGSGTPTRPGRCRRPAGRPCGPCPSGSGTCGSAC